MGEGAATAGDADDGEEELLEMEGGPDGGDGAEEFGERVKEVGDVHHYLVDDVDEGGGAAAGGSNANEETDSAERQGA